MRSSSSASSVGLDVAGVLGRSFSSRAIALGLPWVILVSTFGCDDPLVDPAVVVAPRVIAVQLQVEDEDRAQPLPGESFVARVFLAAPTSTEVSVAVRACKALPTTLGVARCDGEAFDDAQRAGDTGSPFEFELTLDDGLDAGQDWVLSGVVCQDGSPGYLREEARFECSEGAGKEFFVRTPIVALGDTNDNPDLSDDELRYDGALWQPALDAPPPGAPCREAMVPLLGAGERVDIEFRMLGDDREAVEVDRDEYGALDREGLVFTHMATVPGLERPFSSITATDEATVFNLGLTLDQELEVSTEGELAIFYLVVRDDRGGVDVLERAFCAVP